MMCACAGVFALTAMRNLSGSMEPAFYRGDLLFLTNPANQRYQTGDITVYKLPQGGIPIVHRVIEARDLRAEECPELLSVDAEPLATASTLTSGGKGKRASGDVGANADAEVLGAGKPTGAATSKPLREACRQLLLTKGDNNAQDDIALYGHQLKWLERRHIVGKVRGYVYNSLSLAVRRLLIFINLIGWN